MEKVSVIIPVFCAEVYISQCIESVLKQTYKNIELILINDGSLDNSFQICEKYSNQDARIILVNQPNSGVSISRNKGLEIASGEYITFIDSDDWVEENYIETMLDGLKRSQSDIIMCGRVNELFNSVKVNSQSGIPAGIYSANEFLSYFITPGKYNISTTVHCKMYKSSLLKLNSLFFKNELRIDEDYIYNLEALLNSKNIISIDECIYHYRKNPNSLTNNYREHMWENKLKVYNYSVELIKKYNREEYLSSLKRKALISFEKYVLNEYLYYGYRNSISKIRESFIDTKKYSLWETELGLLPRREKIFIGLLKNNQYLVCYLLMKLGILSRKCKILFLPRSVN